MKGKEKSFLVDLRALSGEELALNDLKASLIETECKFS